MERLQRTIKREITFQGIGLHTGRFASVRIKPAPRDTGLVFYRTDKDAIIKAHVSSVIDTAFATTIGYDGIRVRTVEHLLAAAAGLGVDNLFIEIDGPEVPVLDGSATVFVDLFTDAGVAKQAKKISAIKILRPVVYEDSHCRIMGLPYEGRRLSYHLSFNHAFLGQQEMTIDLDEMRFSRDIAPARTFGFLKDVEMLRANGLAKGGSLDNAVIFGDEGVLNASGLRFPDEMARHKILDAIGDFSLAGHPIEGHIVMERSGHAGNCNFLRKLLRATDCYEIVSPSVDQLAVPVLHYN